MTRASSCRPRRAAKLVETLQALLEAGSDSGLRWVELSGRGFTVSYTPFEVATRLGELMKAQGGAWIFTSATLAVGDDFSHFLGRIGAPAARTVRIDSPFDFERQAMLYLPGGLPDPASRDYTERVLEVALPLIDAAGGRSFILFTSHRALREAARILCRAPRIHAPLSDAGAGRGAARIVAASASANSAMRCCSGPPASGRAWTCAAMRWRWSSSTSCRSRRPRIRCSKARLEGIRRRGGNPFREFQLPQAVLALKQGFGRLIRDREDLGVVAICDPRLRTRGYGAMFLGALPPARVVTESMRRQNSCASASPRRAGPCRRHARHEAARARHRDRGLLGRDPP